MSSFTWLDSSEQQRRQMLNVIHLFREKETRDELGIGAIRDAFADLFFPGTSTIQTRARYFLFIPWIYTTLEAKRTAADKLWQRARRSEVDLINTLFNNGATDGLIGINARGSLKRLPSAIYWQGLGAWGIRLFPGPQASYHRSIDGFYAANSQVNQVQSENWGDEDTHETQLRQVYNWHTGVRELRPGNFPVDANFALNREEAVYLQERILSSQPDSLLAFFAAEKREPMRTNFPWEHPAWSAMPARLHEQLYHARRFSLSIHGAPLLYNLMLAEKAQANSAGSGSELVDHYREALALWAEEMAHETSDLSDWDWQGRFWQIVRQGNHHISWRTEKFFNDWLRLALESNPAEITENAAARQLIQQRERRLKGKLSRLYNSRALELWNGAAGTGRLNYRWGVAQTMLGDIWEDLDDA